MKKIKKIKKKEKPMPEFTMPFRLPEGEEPIATAMVVISRSGKSYIFSAASLLDCAAMFGAGVQIAITNAKMPITEDRPRIITPK